jgi:hypothetical protein
MQLVRAIEILGRLRDGEDPRTGRSLPPGSPTQEPDVVRALYTVLAALPEGGDEAGARAAAPHPPRPHPTRAGRPWSADEDACLGSGFDEGRSVAHLARTLERSPKAVRIRLVKLGRLSPDDAPMPRGQRQAAAAAVG